MELKDVQALLELDTETAETRIKQLDTKEDELEQWNISLKEREEQVAKREAEVTWREKERAAKDYQLLKFTEVFNK